LAKRWCPAKGKKKWGMSKQTVWTGGPTDLGGGPQAQKGVKTKTKRGRWSIKIANTT